MNNQYKIEIESDGKPLTADAKELKIISSPVAIACLRHEPTLTSIYVYKKIPWFQRLFIKWCFGLKYIKI